MVFPRLLACLLLVGTLAGPCWARADSHGTPDRFLTEFTDRAIAYLTDPAASEAEKEVRFRALLNEGFDVPAISRFILGRYVHAASEAEIAEFTEVFQDYLVQRFLPLFAEYRGETLTPERVRPDPKRPTISWVSVRINLLEGEPIYTDWRVRHRDEAYQILDVKAEGASMAITLREEFSAVMRRKGGVRGLISEMRALLERGAFRPDA